MGQNNWNGIGPNGNGYQMPPTTVSSAQPPLPPLPPPPPPPPSVPYEPPAPGSGAIKFSIPSKGINKLHQAKPVQVPQYPLTNQASSTSTQQANGTIKSPNSTNTPGNTSAAGKDWPDGMRKYTERCYQMCKTDVEKNLVELILKGKLTSAVRAGNFSTRDWDNEPLPNLTGVS